MSGSVREEIEKGLDELEAAVIDWSGAEKVFARVLEPLLEHEGYEVSQSAHGSEAGVDLIGQTVEEGSEPTRIAVEMKYRRGRHAISAAEIHQLMGSAVINSLNRVLLVTNTDFTDHARSIADRDLPISLQLLGITDLRHWANSVLGRATESLSRVAVAVRELSREIARAIAQRPAALVEVEWRDLERVMAEVFHRFGFEVELTPPAKDGGKDIVLSCRTRAGNQTFFVEVKHWVSGKRVGQRTVEEFVGVVAREQAERGLLLSTSGYTSELAEAISQIERAAVQLQGEEKIIALCRTFERSEAGLWSPPTALPDLLFARAYV